MSEQEIRERIEELKSELQQVRDKANALGGAIQDCNYWLARLKGETDGQNTI